MLSNNEAFGSQLDLDLLDQVDVDEKIDLQDLFFNDRAEHFDFSALSSSKMSQSLHGSDASHEVSNTIRPDSPDTSLSCLLSRKRMAHGPSQRGARKLKKPNGFPKRPLSAYNLFFKRERHIVFEQYSRTIGFEELGKVIGQRWKELSKEDRREYEQAALVDAKRYQKDMEAFDEKRRRRIHTVDFAAEEQATIDKVDQVLSDAAAKKVTPRDRELFNSSSPINVFETKKAGPPSLPSFAAADTALHASATPPVDGSPRYGPPDVGMTPQQLPEGALVHIADDQGIQQVYQVQYVCYRMPRRRAEEYLRRLVGRSPMDHPPMPEGGTHQEV